MRVAITICATTQYTYALGMQANAVVNCIREYNRRNPKNPALPKIILVGSGCEKQKSISEYYEKQLNCSVVNLTVPDDDKNKNYKSKAQLLIAKLRTLAFNEAKRGGETYCWSLDSDVIPKPNALACMADTLKFDDGYYGVASCVYPSQGGGLFLCGRGSPRRHILEDIYPDEKEVPEVVLKRAESYDKEIESISGLLRERMDQDLIKKIHILNKKRRYLARFIDKKCKPKTSNVFELNFRKWRRRGWFDFAYPAIGKGAMVPTDWMGFGCALIGSKALNLIDFSGYNGGGTEDLYIIWNRWHPNGIKIAALSHCPADHIIRDRIDKGKYWHIFTYHETEGEFVDHLRQDKRAFVEFEP